MKRSLILGGTRGLGLALARESLARGIEPIVTGRSAGKPAVRASLLAGATPIVMDLADDAGIDKAASILEDPAIEYFIWNAGVWRKKAFREFEPADIDAVIRTNLSGPLKVLLRFHQLRVKHGRPYRLVVISSASAWRIRENEAVYCASKDAQAVFALNFADELSRELPGSTITIAYPGGIKTPIFEGTGVSTNGYMDPAAVAKAIWHEATSHREACREVHILRDTKKNDGSFAVEYGPKPRGTR